MKSYNEALVNAKLSMGYAVSQTGLRALRTIIVPCVSILKPKRKSFLNVQHAYSEGAGGVVDNHVKFQTLMKEIDMHIATFELLSHVEEPYALVAHSSNDSGLPPSPQFPRKGSVVNRAFLKQNSTSYALPNSNKQEEEFELSSAVTTENYSEKGCCQCIIG